MRIVQLIKDGGGVWNPPLESVAIRVDLALVFGARSLLEGGVVFREIRSACPQACITGCSTAGEIHGSSVTDQTVVATLVEFSGTRVTLVSERLDRAGKSEETGQRLARRLDPKGLVHVLVFSDGLTVNGSELVDGLCGSLPPSVAVTGGLSADGPHFRSTVVLANASPEEGVVAAVGFYSDRLKVAFGSLGGWDPFGPERLITRSSGNILYEFDGKSALELYKTYLGPYATQLPASGLLFPLLIRKSEDDPGTVRTILSIDEQHQSMVFAGDVPQGSYARLMMANFDRLIDGATGAARRSQEALGAGVPGLALLISCVGRKLVLKQRTEEEVEAVRDVLGGAPVFTGFYSYGEISPLAPGTRCELHNQTMTITTFSET